MRTSLLDRFQNNRQILKDPETIKKICDSCPSHRSISEWPWGLCAHKGCKVKQINPSDPTWACPKKIWPRKIVIHQHQSPGDVLILTRAISDLKQSYPQFSVDIKTTAMEIWENNPWITKIKDDEDGVESIKAEYDEINISGWNGLHFTDAFRHDLEKKLGVPIKKTSYRPELWISDLEKSWINQAEQDLNWKKPFWLINAGCKPDNELKQYHRWQEVVTILNGFFRNRVGIIQIGHKDHQHSPLKGVMSLIGKTDNRQLIRLAYWARGIITPISFPFVIAAAFDQPCVCIAGGKEGIPWHTYPHIRYLHTNGALSCCRWDGCWLGGAKGKCKQLVDNIPKCFTLIEPYMIADAVKMYYKGGRLEI